MFENTNQTTEAEIAATLDETNPDLDWSDGDNAAEEMAAEANDAFLDGLMQREGSADADEVAEPSEIQKVEEETHLLVRYLGKEMPLAKESATAVGGALGISEEEVVSTLQKGLNYDRTVANLKNAKEFEILDHYAGELGMSRQQYLKALDNKREKQLLEREVRALGELYPTMAAEELVGRAKENLRATKQAAAQQQRQREEETRRAPWVDFFAQNPDLRADQIPGEVYTYVRMGMDPISAYLKAENLKLQRELFALRQNRENQSRTVGSSRGQGEPYGGDPFLEGFNSIFE